MVNNGGILPSMRRSRPDHKTERQLRGTNRTNARFRGVQHNQMCLMQKRLVGTQLTLTPLASPRLSRTNWVDYLFDNPWSNTLRMRNRRRLG